MKTEKTIWQKSREELFQELSSTPEGLTGAEARPPPGALWPQ